MNIKSADGFTLTLGKDPTHDGKGHVVVHLTHRDGRQLWASFRVSDIVEELPLAFFGATEREDPPVELQPPAELVEFAERHGVEVEHNRATKHFDVCVGRAVVGYEPGGFYALHEDHRQQDGDTIPEALASLAAATVDDEEAHLEVCGLVDECVGGSKKAFRDTVKIPDGCKLEVCGHGWWVHTTPEGSHMSNGIIGKTPWLAWKLARGHVLRLAKEMEAPNA